MYLNPDDGKTYLLRIFKAHHSLMDGVSAIGLLGAVSENFGPHLFIKFPEVTFLQRLALRVLVPFQTVVMIINALFISRDDNQLTKNKKILSGKMNAASSKTL